MIGNMEQETVSEVKTGGAIGLLLRLLGIVGGWVMPFFLGRKLGTRHWASDAIFGGILLGPTVGAFCGLIEGGGRVWVGLYGLLGLAVGLTISLMLCMFQWMANGDM